MKGELESTKLLQHFSTIPQCSKNWKIVQIHTWNWKCLHKVNKDKVYLHYNSFKNVIIKIDNVTFLKSFLCSKGLPIFWKKYSKINISVWASNTIIALFWESEALVLCLYLHEWRIGYVLKIIFAFTY